MGCRWTICRTCRDSCTLSKVGTNSAFVNVGPTSSEGGKLLRLVRLLSVRTAMAGMTSMPSMLLLESLFDPPQGFNPTCTDCGKHAHQGPPVSLHANCPQYRPLMVSHSQMDNAGFQDTTTGMDPDQHVRWLQATGQESSCADIDSVLNQGVLGSGVCTS